jgi:hypothetical protein
MHVAKGKPAGSAMTHGGYSSTSSINSTGAGPSLGFQERRQFFPFVLGSRRLVLPISKQSKGAKGPLIRASTSKQQA